MSIKRQLPYFILFVVVSFAALGMLVKQRQDKQPNQIIHAHLNQHDLYIPKAYLKFGHTSVGDESALIQAWYPGSAIVPGNDPGKLLREGIWWKNIMILISGLNRPPPSIINLKSIKYLNATETVGNEYGLIHKSQPKEGIKDNYDVWYEMNGNEPISYITCMEHITKNDHPQCSHYFYLKSGFLLQISYNRNLLPEWKTIKDNVEVMFDSFQSLKSAEEFIRLRTEEMQH